MLIPGWRPAGKEGYIAAAPFLGKQRRARVVSVGLTPRARPNGPRSTKARRRGTIRLLLPSEPTSSHLPVGPHGRRSHVLAPVDVQLGAVHVARLLSAQEVDGLGHLLRLAQPP